MDETAARTILHVIEASREASLRHQLYAHAIRYARIRTDWSLADATTRKEMDRTRTLAHDALIDALNILSRAMLAAAEDNSWRALLGEDRKTIGDFACWLHALLGIRAR